MKKTDDNQSQIVKALRQVGCTVTDLSAVGNGCPDLLVGRNGVNYLLEVKDGNKPPSARKLTPHQIQWHESWRGQKIVVNSVDEAIKVVMNLQ